jgi:tetratricopeptide (TPR) repeat protein
MARRLTRKEMKHDEFVETAWEAGAWLEENWQTAAKVAAAVVVVGAIALFWWWYTTNSKAQAADLLAEGIAAYGEAAADDFADTAGVEAALQIFEQSIDKAESSPAGRSASYYRGVALIQLGRVDEAIEALEELTSKDLPPTLAANTRVILADALASSGQAGRPRRVLPARPGPVVAGQDSYATGQRRAGARGVAAHYRRVSAHRGRDRGQSTASHAVAARSPLRPPR